MITLKQYCVSELIKEGLHDIYAEQIVNEFAAAQDNDSLEHRWHECCKCCPQDFLDNILKELNESVLNWVETQFKD